MIQRRTALLAALGLGATLATRASPLHWAQRSLLGLGTTLRLQVAHADAGGAERALDAAVAVIREVEAAMSLFRPDSELQRLNRDGELRQPSPHLLAVLRAAQHVAWHSPGAVDPTLQPRWLAYAQAQAQGRLPTAAALTDARSRIGHTALRVQPEGVRLLRPGMAVTLNGIAQGYAADAAREVLLHHGVQHALLDTGEFAAWGRNADARDWTLAIDDPHHPGEPIARLHSDGRCVATSADNLCAFTADHRHHHIFDPATGDSPTQLSSVTVAAPSAMLADALTKVMFVAGPERIAALAKQWRVGVLWVDKRGHWGATADLRLG
jgi:thiamine biosynthesis lipoprotein